MGRTQLEGMSGQDIYQFLPDTDAIREQEGWDEYLDWCRRQENSPHE